MMFTFILDEHKFFDMMEDEKLMVSFDIPPMSFFLPEIRAMSLYVPICDASSQLYGEI